MTDITVKVLAKTANKYGEVITTLQLRYPRFIHSEFMTHRVFSRNASSSRAIPVSKEADEVFNHPALPLFYGKNKPGMQADTEQPGDSKKVKLLLEDLGKKVAAEIELINARYGIHKQVLNRYLEPWLHIDVVVTSTTWSNFFQLRNNDQAEPHMHLLAKRMLKAIRRAPTKKDDIHLPYYNDETDKFLTPEQKEMVCAARCARVSYRNHDGKVDVEKDLQLAENLLRNKHLSPFEHVAIQGDDYFANFAGWQSLRHRLGY